MLDRKGCNRIYNVFLSCAIDQPKHELKWENIFNIAVNHNWWQRHYKIPFQVTHDTKLQWLQYRITHRILGTNSYLFKIRYINSDVCSFCSREKETIKHLFWDCIYINPLIGEFVAWIKDVHSENFELEAHDMILERKMPLLFRIYFSCCWKVTSINIAWRKEFQGYRIYLILYLKFYQKIEKYIYCNKNQIHAFQTRWSNLLFD